MKVEMGANEVAEDKHHIFPVKGIFHKKFQNRRGIRHEQSQTFSTSANPENYVLKNKRLTCRKNL